MGKAPGRIPCWSPTSLQAGKQRPAKYVSAHSLFDSYQPHPQSKVFMAIPTHLTQDRVHTEVGYPLFVYHYILYRRVVAIGWH